MKAYYIGVPGLYTDLMDSSSIRCWPTHSATTSVMHVLHITVNWCFELNNIQEANRRVVDTIHSLDLANNYVYKPSVIHSSCNGKKVNISVDSLHANYSFKYFGRDKGATMYTLY